MSALTLLKPMDQSRPVDDSELIRRAIGPRALDPARAPHLGGDEAFAELIRRYEGQIFRLIDRFTRDSQETEDLAQEVFLKVYRKLHTFQFNSSFYTWIYRIAANTASDFASRRKRRRVTLADDVSDLDTGGENDPRDRSRDRESPADPLMRSEMERITRDILATLPVKYRTILVLREYEDLSYTEMAEVLGCSIGTVESRLFRARQRFKAELVRLHPELIPGLS
jgi:RNA polymerase sigma-70 factor (ECF subfamily)